MITYDEFRKRMIESRDLVDFDSDTLTIMLSTVYDVPMDIIQGPRKASVEVGMTDEAVAMFGERVEAPDGSGCEHPEEERGPLPYQGRPARPDEWECGSCGAWRMASLRPTRDDVRRAEAKAIKSPIRARVTSDPLLDAVRPMSYNDALDLQRQRAGAVVADAVVARTDQEMKDLVYEMETLAGHLFPRRDPSRRRWELPSVTYYELRRLAPPPMYSYGVAHIADRLLGHPITVVDDGTQEIRLVCE